MEESPRIKVTDRRMFTSEGELREDAELELEEPGATAPPEPSRSETAARAPRAEAPGAVSPPTQPAAEQPPAEAAGWSEQPASGVGFLDLVGMLAEPTALYLGDLALPGGERTVDLDQARVYIDLLGVLQEKTRGNLGKEEEAVLSDLVYRLKMRYVQKRQGA
jgi:hypothetical protein